MNERLPSLARPPARDPSAPTPLPPIQAPRMPLPPEGEIDVGRGVQYLARRRFHISLRRRVARLKNPFPRAKASCYFRPHERLERSKGEEVQGGDCCAALMRTGEGEGRGKRRTLCCAGLNHRFSANFSCSSFPSDLVEFCLKTTWSELGGRINLYACYPYFFRPKLV